jgi:hypothetical protein
MGVELATQVPEHQKNKALESDLAAHLHYKPTSRDFFEIKHEFPA